MSILGLKTFTDYTSRITVLICRLIAKIPSKFNEAIPNTYHFKSRYIGNKSKNNGCAKTVAQIMVAENLCRPERGNFNLSLGEKCHQIHWLKLNWLNCKILPDVHGGYDGLYKIQITKYN